MGNPLKQKITLLFLILPFLVNSQKLDNEIGLSMNASLMKWDRGYVPGLGLKIDHRINLYRSKFVIKNSIGATVYSKKNITDFNIVQKDNDYLFMFDAMLEYDFIELVRYHNYNNKMWVPYIGGGFNTIYRSPGIGTDNYEERYKQGIYITLKGSLGIKYIIGTNTLLVMEGYLEWDFSDKLDGYIISKDTWYRYDHTANFSIGIIHTFQKKKRKDSETERLPFSGVYSY